MEKNLLNLQSCWTIENSGVKMMIHQNQRDIDIFRLTYQPNVFCL